MFKIKILSIILLICLISIPVNAQENTEDIKTNIEEINNERETIKNLVDEEKEKLEQLEREKAEQNRIILEYDEQLRASSDILNNISKEIEEKNNEIEEANILLDKAIEEQTAKFIIFKRNAQTIFELGSSNFQAFNIFNLKQQSYLNEFKNYSNICIEEYMASVKAVNLLLELLAQKDEELEKIFDKYAIEENNSQQIMFKKLNVLYSSNKDIEEQNVKIELLELMMREREELIAQIMRESGKYSYFGDYDGEPFVIPCPDYGYISSDFAMRWGTMHNGVDFAAPGGTPIVAAQKGIVKACNGNGAWNGGMGSYVIIDHGSGLTTTYMHASRVDVYQGQLVEAGDQIALVGTTGWSTGNHLHFQVEENRKPVSPWKYMDDPRK